MKKMTVCLLSVAVCMAAEAQLKAGSIIYERKVNIHRNLPKENESMKNMMAEFSTSKVKLLFSGDESVSTNVEDKPDLVETAGEEGGNRIRIRMMQPNTETYKNYKLGKTTEQRELGPRKYIIEDNLPQHKWQLTAESKTIKGYNCKKALTKNQQDKEVVAWYAEEIPCPSGPEAWGGLPGMILERHIDDDHVVYSALSIESNENGVAVKSPSGGKKISGTEFEKMENESRGPEGRGRVIIRTIDQ